MEREREGAGLLLDEEFLRKLERLHFLLKLKARGRLRGQPGGIHHSPRAGMSLEFADYKRYSPGDDFRYVDWKIYGRLDRLLIKVFTREEELPIYLLLDRSGSMEIGGKFAYMVQLAAALAYLGLKDFDRVGIYAFAGGLDEGLPPRGGTRQLFQLFRYLEGLSPSGASRINRALGEFAARRGESGFLLLLSDMLTSEGYEEGLLQLLWGGFEVAIVQLLAEEDLDPLPAGEVLLRDAEGAGQRELYLDEAAAAAYRRRLEGYLARLRAFCLAHGIEHLLLPVSVPLERAIFELLRERAILR